MKTIALIDDHTLVRNALQAFLESTQKFKVISSADNGMEGIENLKFQMPDILLLDIEMPKMDGIKVIREVRKLYPDLPVLILSFFNNPDMQFRVIKEGANGIVSKSVPIEELVMAIETTLDEGFFLPTEIGKLQLSRRNSDVKRLNEKELKMIEMIINENSIEQIAEEIGITKRSAENARIRLKEKLGVSTTQGVVRYAISNGLVYFSK